MEDFRRYELGLGGGGLYMEGLIFGILRYSTEKVFFGKKNSGMAEWSVNKNPVLEP